MSATDLKLGLASSEILLSKYGRSFSEGWIEINSQDRTASGRLVTDIKAQKKKFTIEYDDISHARLVEIASLYELQMTNAVPLSLIVSRPSGVSETFTVMLKPFDHTRAKAVRSGYWTGISLEMEEV